MYRLGLIIALMLAPLAAAAQPACTAQAPAAPSCQSAATNLQATDILYGQQAVGPLRSNQTVQIQIQQIVAGNFPGSFSTLTALSQLVVGAPSSNALTVTPGLVPTQPIQFTQSGTGGLVIQPELFLTGAGTGLSVNNNANVGGILNISAANPITLTDTSTHKGAITLSFPTWSALLAWQPTNIGTSMIVATTGGFASNGDGGGATYVWNATSNVSDGSHVFFMTPTGWVGAGQWVLQIPKGGVSLKALGATCNGVSDDSAAISNRLSVAFTNFPGGFETFVPTGATCYIGPAVSVTVNRGQVLRGTGGVWQTTTASGVLDFDGQLFLSPSTTLKVSGTIENLGIYRFGLPNRPTTMEQLEAQKQQWAAESSVAVTCQGDDCTVRNVQIVGFNKGFLANGFARTRIDNVHVMATNGWEVTGSGGAGDWEGMYFEPFWGANLSGHYAVTSITSIGSGGSGGTNGAAVVTMTATGNTCSTLPQVNVTISGGAITAVNSMADVGDCTAIAGPNPIAFTGAGLTGATLNIFPENEKYESGIGLYIHDRCDACLFHTIVISGPHIGIKLVNLFTIDLYSADVEPGTQTGPNFNTGDLTAIGLDADNNVSGGTGGRFSDLYLAGGLGTALYLNNGGGGPPGATFSNLFFALPATWPNQEMMHVAASAEAIINGLVVGGPGAGGGASVVFDAGVSSITINGEYSIAGSGVTTPWYIADSSSTPNISIVSRQRVVPLNSGATLTALCNDTIFVNDTTAPTITMPATCPLNQNVLVKDIGGNAAAHNITLSMPGGSTIDGSSTFVISTNHGVANVGYNGVAASVQ